MQFERTVLTALRVKIQFEFGPCAEVGIARTAMDWCVPGHVLREGQIDRVTLWAFELVVKALRRSAAHVVPPP